MLYAKVIRCPGDEKYLYKRYIGFDKTCRYLPNSSDYIFKEYNDVAVFAGEFESEIDCFRNGVQPLGISKKSQKILGFKIISQDISSLREGQIVRVFRKGGREGGSILVPYDSTIQFVGDVELSELIEADAKYQEFLNVAALKMCELFKHDLLASREAFLKELKEYRNTVYKILSDEEIEYEVEGMRGRVSTRGLDGMSGDRKTVYRYHLGKSTKIFDNLNTPFMGMFRASYERGSVLLSGSSLSLAPYRVGSMVEFTKDGEILIKDNEVQRKLINEKGKTG